MNKDIWDIYRLIINNAFEIYKQDDKNYVLSGKELFSYVLNVNKTVELFLSLEDSSYWKNYYDGDKDE